MKQKRRGFIFTVAASLGVASAVAADKLSFGKKRPYRATLTCKTNTDVVADFYNDQKAWENPENVIAICERYKNEGRLLSSSFKDNGDVREWDYVFASRLDFEAWFKEIYISGSFDPLKVPQKYVYTVDGEYV